MNSKEVKSKHSGNRIQKKEVIEHKNAKQIIN